MPGRSVVPLLLLRASIGPAQARLLQGRGAERPPRRTDVIARSGEEPAGLPADAGVRPVTLLG